MPIHAHLFRRAIFTNKVGQPDIALVCDQGSRKITSLCVVCASATICATLLGHAAQLKLFTSSDGVACMQCMVPGGHVYCVILAVFNLRYGCLTCGVSC